MPCFPFHKGGFGDTAEEVKEKDILLRASVVEWLVVQD